MGVWDTATPAGSDPISQGDDRIRELKTALQEALRGGATEGDEAVFPGAAPTTAPIFRYRGLKGSTAARPAASAGGLYYNTTTGTLQRSNGSSWDDVTENAAYEAIHQAVAASLASALGVVTLPETGNSFNVSGTEAVTSIVGWSAGVVIIKWTQARTLTHASSLYLKNALTRTVAADDISVFEFTASNSVREIAFSGGVLPTRQTFLSGSGTYTTPVGARHLRIRVLGGGGGGGAANTNAGTAGTASSFNSIAAAGGGAGTAGGTNGPGGPGGTGGSGSAPLRLPGGYGGIRGSNGSIAISLGHGGGSVLGPGAPAGNQNAAGADGLANTGGGGAGGNGDGASANWGGGGGGGEYIELNISNPSATYAYAVGAGGAGGAAGTFAGGAGGSGIVIVD